MYRLSQMPLKSHSKDDSICVGSNLEGLTLAKWAASWWNQQNGMCAQQRLRSAWTYAQSDQSSLSAWRKLGSLATHWAQSEDSDQTGRMPRLIWVFPGRTVIFLVSSWGGSNGFLNEWMVFWMNEWMNEQMNERTNENGLHFLLRDPLITHCYRFRETHNHSNRTHCTPHRKFPVCIHTTERGKSKMYVIVGRRCELHRILLVHCFII